MQMLLPIHIVAGGLAIVLGFVALFVKKGGTIHRGSGMLFVYAMLVIGITASMLEFLHSGVTNLGSRRKSIGTRSTAPGSWCPATRCEPWNDGLSARRPWTPTG